MTVVSLVGFKPPSRYDGVPWASVTIQESAIPDVPWVTIDTLPVLPLDADPKVPATRSFTTVAALLDTGWYRLRFADGVGHVSTWSEPVRHSAVAAQLPPTPEDVRDSSELLRVKYPIGDPDSERRLRNVVYTATATVQGITGRLIDTTLGVPEDIEPGEAVPKVLVPVALRAVTLMTEEMAATGEAAIATQAAQGRRLRSISAGPWSESYFAPGEFSRRGVAERPPMNANPQLDTALWLLATEDAQALWIALATGTQPPVGVGQAVDYRRQGGGYFGTRLQRGYGVGPDGY